MFICKRTFAVVYVISENQSLFLRALIPLLWGLNLISLIEKGKIKKDKLNMSITHNARSLR
jgi:hypothetical protein